MDFKEELYASTYHSILSSIDKSVLNDLQEAVVMREMAYLGKKLSGIRISTKQIIKEVEDYFDVPMSLLNSPTKKKEVVRPRQIIMWLIYKNVTGVSQSSVGALFGRDHTTVFHACKTVEMDIQTNTDYRDVVSIILNNLGYRTSWKPFDKEIGGVFTYDKNTTYYEKEEIPTTEGNQAEHNEVLEVCDTTNV